MLNVTGKARVFTPKFKFLPSGTAFCELGLGNGSKNKDGSWKNFIHDAKAFGKTAEALADLGGKDIQISEASFNREEWEKDGVKKKKDVIVVWKFSEVVKDATGDDENIPF